MERRGTRARLPVYGAPARPVPSVPDMQAHWAVFYYEQYGYWTSVNSALACWALITGDAG